MKNNALIIGIVASICFFLAAAIFGFAYYQSKKPAKTVSVVGMAQKDFTSDLIVWRFSFSTMDESMQGSYTKLKNEINIVKAFLKKEGVTRENLYGAPIDIIPTVILYRIGGYGLEVHLLLGYSLFLEEGLDNVDFVF